MSKQVWGKPYYSLLPYITVFCTILQHDIICVFRVKIVSASVMIAVKLILIPMTI